MKNLQVKCIMRPSSMTVFIYFLYVDAIGGMCYLFHDQLRGGHSDTDSFLLQCTEHFRVVQITP